MSIAKIQKLGYNVEPAFGDDSDEMVTVYKVTGFGITTYVAEDDKDTLKSLADEDAAKENKKQHKQRQEVAEQDLGRL